MIMTEYERVLVGKAESLASRLSSNPHADPVALVQMLLMASILRKLDEVYDDNTGGAAMLVPR
jgi:hypothetical protein